MRHRETDASFFGRKLAEMWQFFCLFLCYFLIMKKKYFEANKYTDSYDNEAFAPQFDEEETEDGCDIQRKSKQYACR
jgi:hypothetical protein